VEPGLSRPPVVGVRNLSKAFGGVHALQNVNLAVGSGEVHGLLGQNGSGKSTLIKILAGYHAPDAGELVVAGKPVRMPLRPGQFRSLGIAFVHQDLGLVESLSVMDNLRVGRYGAGWSGPIRWRQERTTVLAALARFDLRLDPDSPVRALRDVDRALLAIVRAVGDIETTTGTGLLVLDEPTVYLPRDSVDQLFRVIRRIASSGKGILFVSHKLGEVMAVTDRVTVLRDGRVAATLRTDTATENTLVEMVLGRPLNDLYPSGLPTPTAERVLQVVDLSGPTTRGVSLCLHRSEILGLTGLAGTGFEEVPYLVYGAQPCKARRITLKGVEVASTSLSPAHSIDAGIIFIPGNRLRDGAVGTLSVADNVGLPVLKSYTGRWGLRLRQLAAATREVLQVFDVRPPDPQRAMGKLSGGNQQKAVLAKWLQTRPSIMLMHEPTQGVDVGARKQIFAQIRASADQGTAVLIASGEYEDLAHICDRVLVFRDGAVAAELAGAALTADALAEGVLKTGSQRQSMPTQLLLEKAEEQ